MKRLLAISILPSILLASCGKVDYSGTYQFRLGKTDGSHLEFTAVLTNDAYSIEGMKKMSLSADLGDEMSPTSVMEQYGDEYPILEPIVDILKNEFKDIKEIPLYYKVTEYKVEKYGYRVDLGTDFVSERIASLKEKYEFIKDLLELLHLEDSTFAITPEQTKYFVGTYISNKALTFEIPVSVHDLEMQYIWYGKSLFFGDASDLPDDFIDLLPGEKGEARFGTHPIVKYDTKGKKVEDQCAEVNETFKKEFSNTYLYDSEGNEIGKFVVEEVEGKQKLICYLDSSYEGSHEHIEGYIYTKSGLGDFDVKSEIKLSVNDDNSTSVTYSEETGKNAAFIDENGKSFKFDDSIKAPFEFRDFHTVNLGLTKI